MKNGLPLILLAGGAAAVILGGKKKSSSSSSSNSDSQEEQAEDANPFAGGEGVGGVGGVGGDTGGEEEGEGEGEGESTSGEGEETERKSETVAKGTRRDALGIHYWAITRVDDAAYVPKVMSTAHKYSFAIAELDTVASEESARVKLRDYFNENISIEMGRGAPLSEEPVTERSSGSGAGGDGALAPGGEGEVSEAPSDILWVDKRPRPVE
jgi:hypothetical protein